MVQVSGYSEDEVEVLANQLVVITQTALMKAVAMAADSLTPAVTASIAFHLPGKHDQKTHGHKHGTGAPMVLDPYGDWGGNGKRPWMASSDPGVRAGGLWADTYEGQQGILTTMRARHAGSENPAGGVDMSSGPLREHARVFNYDTGEKYGEEHLRTDLANASHYFDERLEGAPVVPHTLHRGMVVSNPSQTFHEGDKFSSDASSWSTHSDIARHYATPGTNGLTGHPVMMSVTGAHGIDLDGEGLLPTRLTGSGEHLVRGDFVITGVTTSADGVTYIEASAV